MKTCTSGCNRPAIAKGLCSACYEKARRKAGKTRISQRKYAIQLRYGMTQEDYISLLESQGSGCAICGGVNPNNYRLSVDHDHTTETVRGLLCNACNNMLGHAKDNPDTLKKAVAYLEYARA